MINDNPGILTWTVTPDMADTLTEALNLAVERLQGTTKRLPDGRLEITITIHDEQKIGLCREFVLKMISQSHNKILN